jgi:ABC-type glutathione transport system ATPase component
MTISSGRGTALELSDVTVRYPGTSVPALDSVSLSVAADRTIGIVGESGSGKSTMAKVIVGERVPTAGEVLIFGQRWGHGRGQRAERRAVQMIFQNPVAALNPKSSALASVAEAVRVCRSANRSDAAKIATGLLADVGIPAASLAQLPHQLSGGQCQRVVIARALACEPRLLVADEPTSALDVSVQAQIINLLRRLRSEKGLSLVFISHNIAVIGHVTDEIAVMRGGRIVEHGSTAEVLAAPKHPYTQRLLAASGARPARQEGRPQPARQGRPRPAMVQDSADA